MPGKSAALVLAAWPTAPAGAAVRILDTPSLPHGPGDLLLEDIFLADRHSEGRFDRGRAAFHGLPADRFPTQKSDYEATYVMEHADLSQRLDRMRAALRLREVTALRVPDVEDRSVWAAEAACRERGIPVAPYPVAGPRKPEGKTRERWSARLALTVLGPILQVRFRGAHPRILTTDLGLLDTVVPYLGGNPGIASPGLGIAPRLRGARARYAWVRHPDPVAHPDLRRHESLSEAALALALQATPDLPRLLASAAPLFRRGDVDLVMLPDDKSCVNSALVRVATSHGVPSLVVQHGIMSHPVGFVPLRADRFAAWGEASARWLASRGVDRGRVSLVGNPKYDRPLRDHEALRRQGRALFASRGIPAEAPVAVFLSQPVEARLEAFRMACEAVAGTAWRLFGKIHPAERVTLYEAAAPRGGPPIPLVGGDPDPVVCAADAVLTISSGLGVLAAQLGIPVILLEPRPVERFGTYEDGWPRATDAASMRSRLQEVSGGRYDLAALRRAGEQYGGPADGRAGERVARLVSEIVRARR